MSCRGIYARCGLSYREAEKRSKQIRQRLVPGIGETEAMPGIGVLDLLDDSWVRVRRFRIPLSYGVKELAPGVLGRTRFCGNSGKIVVEVSPETYLDLERDRVRARYTVYHEISHAFQHAELLLRLSQLPHSHVALERGRASHKSYEDTEWQADAIAAGILMPAAGLLALESKGALSTRAISKTFNVSETSAEIRRGVFAKRREQLLK